MWALMAVHSLPARRPAQVRHCAGANTSPGPAQRRPATYPGPRSRPPPRPGSRLIVTLPCGVYTDGTCPPGSRCRPPRADSGDHSPGARVRGLMLPEPQDQPPGRDQPRVGIPVTFPIAADLPAPVRRIGPRRHKMLRTPVPITAVNEHGHLHGREHQVSRATQLRKRPGRHPVPQPRAVHQRAQRQLRPRIPAAVAEHTAPVARRRRPRTHRRRPPRAPSSIRNRIDHPHTGKTPRQPET
jgi:hypothetical protein